MILGLLHNIFCCFKILKKNNLGKLFLKENSDDFASIRIFLCPFLLNQKFF